MVKIEVITTERGNVVRNIFGDEAPVYGSESFIVGNGEATVMSDGSGVHTLDVRFPSNSKDLTAFNRRLAAAENGKIYDPELPPGYDNFRYYTNTRPDGVTQAIIKFRDPNILDLLISEEKDKVIDRLGTVALAMNPN